MRPCSATKSALIKCALKGSCALQCQRMSGSTSIECEQYNDAGSRLQQPPTTFRSDIPNFSSPRPSDPPILFVWLICKIVTGRVRAEFGYALGNFGSERILEVVVVSRAAGADRCSPVIASVPGFHKGRSKISVLPVRDHRFDDGPGLKPIFRTLCGCVAIILSA